jgi:purine-cytosine permease-like protein
MQTLFPFFRRFPRAFFTVVAFLIYTIAGVAGREHFSSILKNFLSIVCPDQGYCSITDFTFPL